MKRLSLSTAKLALAGAALLPPWAMTVSAQDSAALPSTTEVRETAPTGQNAPIQLSYGVPEILKLVHSHVGDDTVIAYIGNSGRIYNLSVSEIVYLKEQGVTDPVLTAMLNQRKKLIQAQAALQTASQSPAPAPAPPLVTSSDASAAQPAPAPVQPTTTYVQPTTTYVQAAPVYTPPPTVYYVPSAPAYYYPPVSLSLGFGYFWGGGYHGGGYHGGHH